MYTRTDWYCGIRRWVMRKWASLVLALVLVCSLLLVFPATVYAHAILLRSDPARGAVLRVPPKQVHLWFTEAITPALSTAQVVTPGNQPLAGQQEPESRCRSMQKCQRWTWG